MNAIAFDPRARTIIDLYQGQQDIARQLVRTVGDPIQRFSEDGLRPMRALRQATQLGFDVDAPTLGRHPRHPERLSQGLGRTCA